MLKGGQSMLARTMDARATRDIDLLSEEADLDAALAELRALAEADLGDFVVFEFVGAVPIKVEDEYRSGLKVAFVPLLGGKRLQEVSIDLVADRVACGEPEIVTPADRIDVAGVPMFDYRVYPLANSLADKLCAMVETHDGKPSSRIKDLVDVAIYATTVDIDGGELCRRVRSEAGARGIVLPDRFSVPDEWKQLYEGAFKKLVSRTGLSSELSDIAAAEALAASLFDPVLARKAGDLHWDHESLSWEGLASSMARMDAAPPSFSDYCTIADTIASGRVVCGPLRCRRGGRRGLSPWQETIEFGSFAPGSGCTGNPSSA